MTFATEAYYKLGKDIVKVQKLLGHSDIKSTMTYIDLDEEEIFEDNKTLLGLRYQDMEEIKATGQVP